MKDLPLFSVTAIVDDSTGHFRSGDADYSIHVGAVMTFLDSYGLYGLEEIERANAAAIHRVREYALAGGK